MGKSFLKKSKVLPKLHDVGLSKIEVMNDQLLENIDDIRI